MKALDSFDLPNTALRTCAMCGARLRVDSKFCPDCGAPQITRPLPAPPPDPRPTSTEQERRTAPILAAVAAVALVVVAGALAVIVLVGRGSSNRDDETRQIAAGATRTLERFDSAVLRSDPGDTVSMAALRAAASQAVAQLGDAQIDLRALTVDRADTAPQADDLRSALAADELLANALASRGPVAGTIEKLSVAADDATRDAAELGLAGVTTGPLVAALQERSRQQAAAAVRRKKAKTNGAGAFSPHTGPGYQAQIPSGRAGANPRTRSRLSASCSEPVSAALTACF
jgi:hypothetical protein